MNSLCFSFDYKASQNKCKLSFSENPNGKRVVIKGKLKLTLMAKMAETFQNISKKKKWAKLHIAHTIPNHPRHYITEIYVKYKDLAKHFGTEEELQSAAQEKRLERLINEILDCKQKPWGFTDRELFETGIERATLNHVLKALPKEFEGNKIYYDLINKRWVKDKEGYSPDNLVKIRKLNEHSYLLKSGYISAEGISKKVYFEPDLLEKKIKVRTKELFFNDAISDAGKEIEAEILKSLKDVPEIVHCESILKRDKPKDKKIYQEYILEYCEQGTLGEAFYSLSRADKIDIYIDVLKGLEVLHEKDYLHFDLHFGNILLKKEANRIVGKLSDFGNARKVEKVKNPLYFIVNMIDNKYWSPNWSAFSPELIQFKIEIMLKRIEEKKDQYQLVEKISNDKDKIKFAKNCLKILEAYPNSFLSKKLPITTKSDIWQMGLMMALHHYDVTPEKLSSLNYTLSLPSYLHFLYTFALYGLKCADMNLHDLYECAEAVFKKTEEPKYKKSFDYVIWRMMQPDPEKRADISEVISLLSEMKKT